MKLGTLRIGKRQAIYYALCSTGCTIQVSVPLLLALLVKIFNSWYREPYPRISVHINLPNTPTKTHLSLSSSSSLRSSIHRLINGQTRNLLAINNLREETFSLLITTFYRLVQIDILNLFRVIVSPPRYFSKEHLEKVNLRHIVYRACLILVLCEKKKFSKTWLRGEQVPTPNIQKIFNPVNCRSPHSS